MNTAQKIADISFIILLVLMLLIVLRTEKLNMVYKTPYIALIIVYLGYRYWRSRRAKN